MSILFTMVRFPPTACIKTYSIRAALEREWSYNLDMSLTDQELWQLSYMLYQRKLVHRMILKTRFFHWGRVNSNHRKTHFLSFSTLIPRIHCLIRHIICIFYVWTHSNLNFGPISFFHQSCTLKLKIKVWCSGEYCHSPSFCWAELGNASEATTPPTTTQTLNRVYLSHFSSYWAEIWHDNSLDDICRA